MSRAKADRRRTLRDWLAFAIPLYHRSGAAFGQVATNAHDEALYLLLRTLELPLDSDARVLARRLTPAERRTVTAMLRRRLVDRVPAAYLTRASHGSSQFWLTPRRPTSSAPTCPVWNCAPTTSNGPTGWVRQS